MRRAPARSTTGRRGRGSRVGYWGDESRRLWCTRQARGARRGMGVCCRLVTKVGDPLVVGGSTHRTLFGINHYMGVLTSPQAPDPPNSALPSLLRNSSDALVSGLSLAVEKYTKDECIVVQAQVSSTEAAPVHCVPGRHQPPNWTQPKPIPSPYSSTTRCPLTSPTSIAPTCGRCAAMCP